MGLKVYSHKDSHEWDDVIKSFPEWDIYDLNSYVRSLLLGSSDEGLLLYFEGKNSRMCYGVIMRDISEDSRFAEKLPAREYYDFETPYGYGGPLFDKINEEDLGLFRSWLYEWCVNNRVVSQFIRFNPIRIGQMRTESMFDEVKYLHHTVFMDTDSEEGILKRMNPKCRNMVRKAQKNDVKISVDEECKGIDVFKRIYKETMDSKNASDMYYFSDEYYEFLINEMRESVVLFIAYYNSVPISASLFLYNERHMHYHLSGTLTDYRKLAAANLILYEAANYAVRKGVSIFHLGGGMTEDDSLFGFKKQFSRTGLSDFYIGKTVFNEEAYQKLVDFRKANDERFDSNNSRMIQYRA